MRNDPSVEQPDPIELAELTTDIKTKFDKQLNAVNPSDRDPWITSYKKILLSEKERDKIKSKKGFHRSPISVCKTDVPRALALLKKIRSILRLRGHIIDEGAIKIQGWEIGLSIQSPPRENAGLLCQVQCGYPTASIWQDSPKLKLELLIPEIIATIELGVDHHICKELFAEKRYALELQEREIRKKGERELEAFKQLLENAIRSRQVEVIREYVEKVARSFGPTMSPEQSNWIYWAHKKCDWFDPLSESSDDLLQDVDRSTLKFKK